MRQALSVQKAETELAHQWLKTSQDMAVAWYIPAGGIATYCDGSGWWCWLKCQDQPYLGATIYQ